MKNHIETQIQQLRTQLAALEAQVQNGKAKPPQEPVVEAMRAWFAAQRRKVWVGTLARLRASLAEHDASTDRWLPRGVDALRAALNAAAPALRVGGLVVEAHRDGTVGVFTLTRRRGAAKDERNVAARDVGANPFYAARRDAQAPTAAPKAAASERGRHGVFAALKRIDLDGGAGVALVDSWLRAHGTRLVRLDDVMHAVEHDGLFAAELGRFTGDAARRRALGIILSAAHGRSFRGHRVVRTELEGHRVFTLIPTDSAVAPHAGDS